MPRPDRRRLPLVAQDGRSGDDERGIGGNDPESLSESITYCEIEGLAVPAVVVLHGTALADHNAGLPPELPVIVTPHRPDGPLTMILLQAFMLSRPVRFPFPVPVFPSPGR